MMLAVVIVSWNVSELLVDCLAALPAAAAGIDYETIVVDNASSDGSADRVAAEFPQVRLIRNAANLGFARANNQGIGATDAEYVLLLNSDTLPPPGSLTGLVRFMDEHPGAGAAGPQLRRPDGGVQPYAFGCDPSPAYLLARGLSRLLFHRSLHNWETNRVRPVDWVSGACLLVRRAAIARAGLLDEKIFMYFEDSDWCLRIRRAGWQVFYDPQVAIVHLGGRSIARNPAARPAYDESLVYFYGKHYGRVAQALLRAALWPYHRLVRD